MVALQLKHERIGRIANGRRRFGRRSSLLYELSGRNLNHWRFGIVIVVRIEVGRESIVGVTAARMARTNEWGRHAAVPREGRSVSTSGRGRNGKLPLGLRGRHKQRGSKHCQR